MKTTLSEVENSTKKPEKTEKLHIGNLKLSESKKAIKGHIFSLGLFFVISLSEIQDNKVGKIYQYVNGNPEIIGEILPHTKGGKPCFRAIINDVSYFIKKQYIKMFQNGTQLTLAIYQE